MWEMVPRLQNSVKSEKMTVDVRIFSMLWQILSLLRPAKNTIKVFLHCLVCSKPSRVWDVKVTRVRRFALYHYGRQGRQLKKKSFVFFAFFSISKKRKFATSLISLNVLPFFLSLPTCFQVGCSCLPSSRVSGRGFEILRLSLWCVASVTSYIWLPAFFLVGKRRKFAA